MGEEQRVELLPVNPAVKRGHGAMKHEVGRLSSAPVALPYLASRVPPDIHVAIVDENVDEINFEKQVDLVGISVLTMSAPRAYEIAALYTVDYYKDTIKRITDHGISVLAGFVFGFDTDDESVFERTVEFAIESKLLYADFNILCPYPGTAVRAKLTEECRIIETDWSKYFGMYNVVFRPRRMSVEALQEGCLWAWKEFYSVKSIFTRSLSRQNFTSWVNPLAHIILYAATHRGISKFSRDGHGGSRGIAGS